MAIEVAKELLIENIPIAIIVKTTKLSTEEVNLLAEGEELDKEED